MRYRPSAERKVILSRWTKDKRGGWRHTSEEVSEVAYCHETTREKPGFHKGARLRKS